MWLGVYRPRIIKKQTKQNEIHNYISLFFEARGGLIWLLWPYNTGLDPGRGYHTPSNISPEGGIWNHPLILCIVEHILANLFLNEILPKSIDFGQKINWFIMISAEFKQKFLLNNNIRIVHTCRTMFWLIVYSINFVPKSIPQITRF